jgi:hypothetical protein
MEEYINEEGDLYTIDEINQTAKDNNTTFEDIVKRNKLGLKTKKEEEIKIEEPGKLKPVVKKDAVATVKSTASKLVKPSSVSQDNVWGKTKSQPDFVTNLEKVAAPVKKDNKLRSFEARSTGNIAPNSDQAWIPSIANYKKASTSETEIPKEFLKKSLEYLKTKEGVKFEIEKQDLDLKDPNLYYSTSKKGDEFVNQNYNSDKLKKLGINPDDFDGFINKKGYKDDFINKDQSGAFQRNWLEKFEDIAPEWMGRSTQSQEEVQFKKEKILNNYLNIYLKDKDKNANLYKQLKDKELNPEKDWQEINKTNKEVPVIDPNLVSEYNKTMFPTIAKIDANKIIEDKKIVEHLRTRSTPMAALEETWGFGKELVGSMWNTSKELIATGQDLIGLDKEADVIRSQAAYDEYKNPDTRGIGGFIKGKSTTIDGIKYQTDDAGNIYNVTHGFNIAGLVDDSEYQNIKKGIQENGKEDWYISPRGAAKSTAQVLGAMVPQIVLTEMTMGLGGAIGTRALATRAGFSSVAEYKNMVNLSEAVGGKVLSKMPLPVTKDMAGAIVTQSAFGYSNGYEQTLKAARDAGINDKDAEALALTAGNQMALLYGATAPLSPQTKARELIFGSAEKRLLKEALNEYRNNGTKGFINNLTSSVKSAARSAVGFVEEGGKEAVQENIQQVGEQEIVNANINELAGQKILKDTYTYQDFVNTSGLAFLSGGMIANAKIPNFVQDPNQRLINLVTLGSNPITFQSNLDELVKSGVATEKEAEALKNDAISTVRQIRKIPKDVDAETSLNLVRKLQEVENLEESKKVIAKPFHQKIDEQINGLNTEITDIYDKRLDVEVERLKTLTSQTDVEEFGEGAINNGEAYNVIDTKEESAKAAENWFVNNNRQDELYEIDDNGNKVKINFESQPAIVLPNGQIIINREIAREVDEGASAGRHELLHKILKSQFNDSIKADELLNKFKGVLSAQENLVVEQRLKDRGYTKEYLSKNQDEYLTQFFEALENKEITATDATFKSMWKSIFRPIYKVLGFEKLDFESGNDIYQFLKDYHKTSKAGKLTSRQKTLLEAGKSVIGTTASSKTASELVKEKIADLEENEGDYDPDEYDQEVRKLEGELKRAIAKEGTTPTIKKEVSEEDTVKEIIKNESGSISSNKVQQIYEAKGKEGAAEIIKLFKPITNKIVDKRRDAPGFDRELLTDEIETGVGGILDLITKYNPESGTPLAAWINKYLPVRAIATSRRILDKQFSKDAAEEKGLMATETADQAFTETAKEKTKYKNALEAKVFEPGVLKTMTGKIITVLRTLKSRIDAPVTLNRTVTPIIAEIRDEVGKQLDIDIKTAMGGKKDGQLKKFALKNKKYFLENMTTTFLMGKDGQGGVPQAIQKQVDGKWVNFPEWVNKKIDREKTTTDQAGRTSGSELVRRLPNVANNISDEVYLAQLIGPDGNPIRGRKESWAKVMAEEGAFDIIKDDFENDGPILKAFNTNQERLGVEINEVLTTEFNKQVDRGNIKFSKISNRNSALFLLQEGGWKKDYAEYTKFLKTLSTAEIKDINYFLKKIKSLTDKYEEVWERNKGVYYEKETYSKLRKLKGYLAKANFSLEEDIPDRYNSIKPDLVFINKNTGNKIVVELKSSLRDPMGSTSNGDFINKDIAFTKEFSGIKDLEQSMIANAGRTKFIDKLKQLIKEGSKEVKLTPKGIQISNTLYEELDRSNTSTYAELPIIAISDINPGKDILQIENYGAFAFPNSNAALSGNFEVLKGKLFVSVDFRTRVAGNGFRTLIERAYFNLDPNFNQKTNINLDNKPQEFLDKIKYSKVKEDAITIDAVTKSLNPQFSKTPKGISVFDFDDTSAFTSGSVLYTMPDGSTGKLNAEEFAKEGNNILDDGGVFDFSEFSKVVNGKPGPMVEKMKKMIAKFGNENFFILTARPANAAVPIKEFLDSIGINIPLENITGLGNSTAQAKADWITAKAAEGYNDFYFADDAIQNVEAVKKALNIPGVDSKVQQAMIKFSLTSKQDLKWRQGDEDLSTNFKVGNNSYRIALREIGSMEYDDDINTALLDIVENNNLDYDKTIGDIDGNAYDVEFSDKKRGTGITGTGNAAEVFGTVLNGVIELANKRNIKAFTFNAKEPSRIKLYNSMTNIIADRLGWDSKAENGTYLLYDKSLIGSTKEKPKTATAEIPNNSSWEDLNKGRIYQKKIKAGDSELKLQITNADVKVDFDFDAELSDENFVRLIKENDLNPENFKYVFAPQNTKEFVFINSNEQLANIPANDISSISSAINEFVNGNNIKTIILSSDNISNGNKNIDNLFKTIATNVSKDLNFNLYSKEGSFILTEKETVVGSKKGIGSLSQVKDVLNVVDVKSEIQQNKIKFSKTIGPEFNRIISRNTGIGPAISYSDIVAKRKGAGKNLFDLYVPASAADFELLLYKFIGKGKEGEAQMKFFSDALLKPYANGNDLMDAARQSIKKNYKELIKAFPGIANKLEKLTPDGNFTYDQALRVAMWNGSDVEIPGLSKRDTNELTSLVNNDAELYEFMSGLIVLGRQGNGWVKPGDNWDASAIISDLHNLTEGEGRKQFLNEFIDNAEQMFGKFENGKLVGPNMNKIEAIYGTDVRESIEDVLYRMINGKNRSQGTDGITNKWLNWVSGSTGTIMFLNTRSAALQLIGAVNFLNLRDNNPIAAGAAFANQKQYWTDFARIWNSDKMKERRGGLKEDVAAAEIANAAATSRNKPTAVVSYLLKIGYTPTQIADSFAIASGGAPYYRNRIKSYIKEGQTEVEAEKNAWNDFTKVSDETQQSGDPRDISKQQASGAGRLLLTFQNTAMQQSRIVKKSFLDLKNGRGDAKTHIAKIAYYFAIQNLMFSALQQGLFAVLPGLGDDDEENDEAKKKRLKEKDNKIIDVVSGVVDSIVRGTGLLGGVLVTLKNVIKKYREEEPKGYKADYTKVLLEATNISPPIGSKVRKVYTALQQTKFDKDLIKERGWGVMQDGRVHLGPLYSVAGKAAEVTTNLPMDRLFTKIENVSQAMNSQNKAWQRVLIGLGWNPRSLGVGDTPGDIKIETAAKKIRAEEGKIKGAETRARTKDSIRALPIARRIEIKREAALKRREEKLKKRKELIKKRKMG